MKSLRRLMAAIACLGAFGCAGELAFREGRQLVEAGQIDAGLAKVREAAKQDPGRQEYRTYYLRHRDIAVQRLLTQGDTLRMQGRADDAEKLYGRALELDATSERAKLVVQALRTERRHQSVLAQGESAYKAGRFADAEQSARTVLAENPRYAGAQALQARLQAQAGAPLQHEPQLDAALQRPITLEFRDTDLKSVFELISRNTGINFFFDRDIRPDLRTTVFVRNAPIEDVIRFILVTNQLERKVLNQNTLLIYPNTPAKIKDYQELVTKSFYLHHADVKQAANMIKGMVKTRDVFFDEKLKLLVMRDTPDAIRMAEKLIAAQDIAESEVMLEVEVMEVASNVLSELGIRFPDQVSFSVVGAAGAAGTLTLPEWQNRDSSLYRISVTNPLLVANLREQDGRATTLANPRIRVKDGQKARVHIGDKVPVITSTLTATAFVAESVSYLDVGLKLEVEPTISLSNEVGIKIGLEVSNIVREIRSGTTLTYQIGTRNANTVLHLRDGETQILAGLISDDDRKIADKVPGLGSLPVLGRLFSSHRDTTTKTEIVLLITPRIVRTVARPEVRITEFLSGTENMVGAPPLVIRTLDKPAAAPPTPGAPQAAAPGATGPGAGQGPVPSSAVVARAEPKPTFPPIAAAPPGLARFALKGPAHVKTGEEFVVAIEMSAEAALRAGTFDLAFDQSRFKAVRVEPGDLLRSRKDAILKHDIQDVDGRVSVSYTTASDIKGEGTLARIVFQVTGPHPGTSLIRMETPSVTDQAGKLLAVPAPVPLTLLLAR